MASRKIAPEFFDFEAGYAPAVINEAGGKRIFKREEIQQLLVDNHIGIETEVPASAVPVALRWRLSQNLGFPITPFNLWRKVKKSVSSSVDIIHNNDFPFVYFLNGSFFRLTLDIKNNDTVDRNFIITPLDWKYREYDAKSFTLFVAAGTTGFISFDQPNTSGVKITGGNFFIQGGKGIRMEDYVNDPDWKLIQVVGLPFKQGAVDPQLYSNDKQGFINSLTDPVAASVQRVDLYKLFYKDPPSTAADGTVLPLWKTPTGVELNEAYSKNISIKNGQTGVLNDLKEMLEMVYTTAPAIYLGKQKNFLKEIQSLGIVDPANPNPKDNGTYKNPVCNTTLLSVSTDCWHSLGLGFGTIDFLPSAGTNFAAIIVPGDLHAFDYMVSAKFRTPIIHYEVEFPAVLKEKFDGFTENEYAALCHFDLQLPPMPSQMLADTVEVNRPLIRDDHYYEDVRISWLKPLIAKKNPPVYAVALRNNISGAVNYLNDERHLIPGKPMPFLPASRSDADAPELTGRDSNFFDRYYHDRAAVPFIGNIIQQYYSASQNVFGLWSNWSIAQHQLSAKAPQVPRLVSASLKTNHEGITNHIYNDSVLEIVLSYDWEDRTPFEIQVGGYFFSPPVANPPVTVPGIVKSNSGGAMEKYVIRFTGDTPVLGKLDVADNFVAVSTTEGEVSEDPTATSGSSNGLPPASDPDIRSYRIKLKQISLNFTAETKLFFALYSRGSENKNTVLQSLYSPSLVINCLDPVAREAPVFTPEIKWAALPDASNISRYHLNITPVTGAVGYAVYRATEMSVRDRMNGITNYPANGSIFQRRDALNLASAADKKAAIDAFIRINNSLIMGMQVELEMDGDTGGLFLYAVSSFTEQGAESPLSDWIYVAVPEKITPAPPMLTGFVNKKIASPLAVLKVTPGAGSNTSTVELFRTTKKYLGADINMMGLPVQIGPAAGWSRYKVTDGINDEEVLDPAEPFDYYKVNEEIGNGWASVYYRVVGLGLNQPVNGKLPGRSASSNLLELLPPPPVTAPVINDAFITGNGPLTQIRLSFKTNAYVGSSPYGSHTVFIYKLNANGLFDQLAGNEIPLLNKIIPPAAEPMDELIRLNAAPNGFFNYGLNLAIEEKITLKIIVTDPLGRSSNAIVSYIKPAPEEGIIISGIQVRTLAGVVRVVFKTNVGKSIPILGQNKLEIILRTLRMNRMLINIAMHDIPDVLKLPATVGIAGGTTRDENGLFTYTAAFRGAAFIKAFSLADTLIIRITDPKGEATEQAHALNFRRI